MAAHVSFGSHPHQRPQACSPQMAPAMVPKVQIGKPSRMARKVRRSRVSSDGSRAAIADPCNHDLTFALRSFNRYRPPKTKVDTGIPDDAIMLGTWILSHQLCRAGTNASRDGYRQY